MSTKNNETTNNRKKLPFLEEIEPILGEIKPKEVNLISNMKESKYIVVTVEKYIDILTTKSFATGKLSVLEKQIEKMEREQYMNKLKEFPKRKEKQLIKKLENEINKLNQNEKFENIQGEEILKRMKAKKEGKIEGIRLAIEKIKEAE